jgi:chromate transport protein ChrA
VIKLWKGAVRDKAALALCLLVFILSIFFKISPIVFVLFCAAAGILFTRLGVRGK